MWPEDREACSQRRLWAADEEPTDRDVYDGAFPPTRTMPSRNSSSSLRDGPRRPPANKGEALEGHRAAMSTK